MFPRRILLTLTIALFVCSVACNRTSPQNSPLATGNAPLTNSNRLEKTPTESILVDFENGTVSGVNLRQEGKRLEAELGVDRVLRTSEVLEGHPSELYVVRFGTHEIFRHWNAFSYKDPSFRTNAGLGVGSTLADFENIYGKGELIESERCAFHFRRNAQSGHFAVVCPRVSFDADAYRATRAEEIWVW